MWPSLVCMLLTSVQRTRPPAAVSLQSMTKSLDSQRKSPSLDWRQLPVKLDVAQSQLLQARTEMMISMHCTEPQHAAGQFPSIRFLVQDWVVSVLAEDVKMVSGLVTCMVCTQGLCWVS